MINNVDDALKALLLNGLPLRKGEVEIAFDQPKREWSARLRSPALNLYLYDIRENIELRTSQQVVRQDLPDGRVALTNSLTRIDLCYLLTAWAKEVQDEHRLLSAALLVLLQHPLLPAEVLSEALKKMPLPVRLDAAKGETASDIADLWAALDNEMRPVIRLKVTLSVEPFEPDSAKPVSETEFRFAEEERGQGQRKDKEERLRVEGRIRSDRYSLSVLKMALMEDGREREIEIRDDGQFMSWLQKEGEYQLEIRANERVIKQLKITVPSPPWAPSAPLKIDIQV